MVFNSSGNVNKIKVGLLNIRSLGPNVDDVHGLLNDSLDVLMLTETWHKSSDNICLSLAKPRDFSFLEQVRLNDPGHGGLVTIVVASDFHIHVETSSDIYATVLADIFSSFDLVNRINQSTHVLGGTLDLIVTSDGKETSVEKEVGSMHSADDFKKFFADKLKVTEKSTEFGYATKVNVALGKNTSSSSTYDGQSCWFYSSKAVDGDYGNEVLSCKCFHSADLAKQPNWMCVDMASTYTVDYARLLSRNAEPQRMDYFIVGVASDNPSSKPPVRGAYLFCGQYPGRAQVSMWHILKCNPFLPKQQYLIVQQPVSGPGYLTVCELEVYPADVVSGSDVSQTIWTKQYMDEPTKTYNVMLLGNVSHETRRRSLLDCVVLCSVEASRQCDSLNYCKSSGLCQLNSHKYGYQRSSIQIVNDDTCRWLLPSYP
ncbi:hypothetical protein HELRODRAFT_172934 [Helobdella robusta]|uniref:Apple domain-containing protein n=1 Tax=Helobdella robusta TaxID=6412 RepID=T1F658_HELRO|nr:hypothetical protein HELRODRAFT_172934 [Helobdella robusta]ESO03906.1 hypothetical protein HELRODRAFT_172934 [Helobdella robusta]